MSHALVTLLTFTVPAVLVLSFIVTVHEFGHFLVARACGVAIDRFSVGFGKAIVSRKDRHGVEWRIGWIPLGGYVKFAGDLNAASVPDQAELAQLKAQMLEEGGPKAVAACYHFKPVWQRALIAFAGPFANFLLAIVLFAILFCALGDAIHPAKVMEVLPGRPAQSAGFQVGDLILKVDGHPIEGSSDAINAISLRAGVPTQFIVQRGAAQVELQATPVPVKTNDRIMGRATIGQIGLSLGGATELRRFGPIQAVVRGAHQSWEIVTTTGFYLRRVLTGQVSPEQIGGVIGVAHTTGALTQEAVKDAPNAGWIALGLAATFLNLSAVLSVSIGLVNLLPIPMLDGGHLVFYAYEAVARRPLPGRIQDASYRVGLALLVGFMLFAAWNDLQRFNLFGGLFS